MGLSCVERLMNQEASLWMELLTAVGNLVLCSTLMSVCCWKKKDTKSEPSPANTKLQSKEEAKSDFSVDGQGDASKNVPTDQPTVASGSIPTLPYTCLPSRTGPTHDTTLLPNTSFKPKLHTDKTQNKSEEIDGTQRSATTNGTQNTSGFKLIQEPADIGTRKGAQPKAPGSDRQKTRDITDFKSLCLTSGRKHSKSHKPDSTSAEWRRRHQNQDEKRKTTSETSDSLNKGMAKSSGERKISGTAPDTRGRKTEQQRSKTSSKKGQQGVREIRQSKQKEDRRHSSDHGATSSERRRRHRDVRRKTSSETTDQSETSNKRMIKRSGERKRSGTGKTVSREEKSKTKAGPHSEKGFSRERQQSKQKSLSLTSDRDLSREYRTSKQPQKTGSRSDRKHHEKQKGSLRSDRKQPEKGDRKYPEKQKTASLRRDQKHPEKQRTASLRRDQKHPEKQRTASLRSDRKHPEKQKTASLRSDRKHPERQKTASLRRDQKHPEKQRTASLRSDRKHPEKQKTASLRSDRKHPERQKTASLRRDQKHPEKQRTASLRSDRKQMSGSGSRTRTDQKQPDKQRTRSSRSRSEEKQLSRNRSHGNQPDKQRMRSDKEKHKSNRTSTSDRNQGSKRKPIIKSSKTYSADTRSRPPRKKSPAVNSRSRSASRSIKETTETSDDITLPPSTRDMPAPKQGSLKLNPPKSYPKKTDNATEIVEIPSVRFSLK